MSQDDIPVCEYGVKGCSGNDPAFLEALRKGIQDEGMVRVHFTIDVEEDSPGGETVWATPICYGTCPGPDGKTHHGYLCKIENLATFYPMYVEDVTLDDIVMTSGDAPHLQFAFVVSKARDTYFIFYGDDEDAKSDKWKENYKALADAFQIARQIKTSSPAPNMIQIAVLHETPVEMVRDIVNSIQDETNISMELHSSD